MNFDDTQKYTVTVNKSNSTHALAPLLITIVQKQSEINKFTVNALCTPSHFNVTYMYTIDVDQHPEDTQISVIIPELILNGGFSLTRDADTDIMFQLCTQHPFTVDGLQQILKELNKQEELNKDTL